MPPKLVLKRDPGITLETLHEDDHVLAISKPFGVLAHPSPGFWHKGTMAHALVERVPEEMLQERGNHNEWDSFIPRCIVHRLDAGTTGVMVIAKSPLAEKGLTAQLRAADMLLGHSSGKKVYVAVLLGHPGGSQCITALGKIGRNPQNPKVWAVTADGKPAKTVFRVHAFSKKHGLSLVTAEIFTGRTHQIRVHAAHLGSPVANDHLYTQKRFELPSLGRLPERRQLLHAWLLDLEHPDTQRRILLRAALPPDMAGVVQRVWPELSLDPAAWPGMLARFQSQQSVQRLTDVEVRCMAWWDASPEGRAWLRDRDAWLKRKRDDCDGDPKQRPGGRDPSVFPRCEEGEEEVGHGHLVEAGRASESSERREASRGAGKPRKSVVTFAFSVDEA
ncbi:unnamed protein product [Effrenium voratum]|nr:unnamed protein product [Effrenium voratum]